MPNEMTYRFSTFLNDVPYRLMEGYPTIEHDDTTTKATEKYLIPASQLAAFLLESIPPPIIFNGKLIKSIGRTMPGSGVLVTKKVSAAPHTGLKPSDPFQAYRGDLTEASYAEAFDQEYVVTINYETMQNDDENENDENKPESFLEHTVNVGCEILSISPKKTKVIEGTPEAYPITGQDQEPNKDSAGGMPIVKIIPTIEHGLKWKYVLNPDWEAIRAALGTTNDKAYPVFFNAPREAVLFLGVQGQQTYLWTGKQTKVKPWSLDFRFSEKSINDMGKTYHWNHVYSPDKGRWVIVTRDGGKPIYPTSDLTAIFKSVSPTDPTDT